MSAGVRKTGSWSVEGGHNVGFPDEGTAEQKHKDRKPVNEQLILSLVTERKRESEREKQYEYDKLELNYGWAWKAKI